jgi:hypothetical protein
MPFDAERDYSRRISEEFREKIIEGEKERARNFRKAHQHLITAA